MKVLFAEKYIAPIPEVERHDFMSAYHRRLTGDDDEVKLGMKNDRTPFLYVTVFLLLFLSPIRVGNPCSRCILYLKRVQRHGLGGR